MVQHLAASLEDGGGDAGDAGDVDAVALVRAAGDDAVQKDDLLGFAALCRPRGGLPAGPRGETRLRCQISASHAARQSRSVRAADRHHTAGGDCV